MHIKSELLGMQEIDPESIIHFPKGLVGLEDRKDFKLFHEVGKSTIFWLQSVDDDFMSFAICAPDLFKIAYEIRLSDEECADLKLKNEADVVVMLMLNRAAEEGDGSSEDPAVRANLQGPLIINVAERRGLQKVLVKPERHVLLRAVD